MDRPNYDLSRTLKGTTANQRPFGHVASCIRDRADLTILVISRMSPGTKNSPRSDIIAIIAEADLRVTLQCQDLSICAEIVRMFYVCFESR